MMEDNMKKRIYMCVCVCVCVYVKLGHFAVQQKLTEYCESTITIIKKKKTLNMGVPIMAQW